MFEVGLKFNNCTDVAVWPDKYSWWKKLRFFARLREIRVSDSRKVCYSGQLWVIIVNVACWT